MRDEVRSGQWYWWPNMSHPYLCICTCLQANKPANAISLGIHFFHHHRPLDGWEKKQHGLKRHESHGIYTKSNPKKKKKKPSINHAAWEQLSLLFLSPFFTICQIETGMKQHIKPIVIHSKHLTRSLLRK